MRSLGHGNSVYPSAPHKGEGVRLVQGPHASLQGAI